MRLQVLLPSPAGGPYDYLAADELQLQTGDYVQVPFARRQAVGVVWNLDSNPNVPPEKLKAVIQKCNIMPLPQISRDFIDWVAGYTMQDTGMVLKLAMSVNSVFTPPKSPRKTKPLVQPRANYTAVTLTPAQITARDNINARLNNRFSVTLLDGVTGSGKTEVYFEAVAKILEQGYQALLLLPEIALTNQLVDRFAQRFGTDPVLWHSGLTPAQRRNLWQSINNGAARVVMGARSALFLPYPDLGLIIVDEEHETAYKQDEVVLYHARDMAIVRAQLGKIPVILASATPSLESLTHAQSGKYAHVELPNRYGGAQLPKIELIDLKDSQPPAQQWLSPELRAAIAHNLAAGEQTLLYLNRRGYAPLVLCRGCGNRINCFNCSAWLVMHKSQHKLQCHHCGFACPIPQTCPHCEAVNKFAPCGPGVERVAEEVAKLYPLARIAQLTSDQHDIAATIDSFARGDLDIVIGTQLLAKGHNFPDLTLVGVVDGDLGLEGADLRAGERNYQLLHQVAGRAGRAAKPGRVMLQTWQPQHPVMQALAKGDRAGFMQLESYQRQLAHLPPFGRLAAVIVSCADEKELVEYCRNLARKITPEPGVRVLGPAPAPLSKLRGKYRQRFLVMGEPKKRLQPYIARWLDKLKPPSAIRVQVDVDPVSFG